MNPAHEKEAEEFAVVISKNGYPIIFDTEFMKKFGEYSWWVDDRRGYPRRAYRTGSIGGKTQSIAIHHEVIGKRNGFVVDHINQNPLDNRRCNLRFCTPSENNSNCSRTKRANTGFRGVYKQDNKFMARLSIGNKRIYLGLFNTPEEAATAIQYGSKKDQGGICSTKYNSPSWE